MTSMDTTALVEGWLGACRPKLPIQNPLGSFIHNNILLNLEDRPFTEAVREAAALYRARPYETEAFYRAELARGRIHRDCLDAVLAGALPHSGPGRVEAFLADASLGDVAPLRTPPRSVPRLPVDERRLQDFAVPLIASFLDQGMAAWPNPYREGPLWDYFVASVRAAPDWGMDWASPLKRRVEAHARAGRTVKAIIAAEVREVAPLGSEADWCLETLFVLKGWSGMVARLEAEPALAPVAATPVALEDWLAVLLVCTRALDIHQQEDVEHRGPPRGRPESPRLGRLHLWQEAYERSFAGSFLAHLERGLVPASEEPPRATPRFQALVCMDDREESFRRALESEDCGVETWGTLGFFGVDMRFQAVGASQPTRQCPPVIEPSRTVYEVPLDGEDRRLRRSTRAGRAEATALLSSYYQSRTLVRGFLVSLALGVLSFLPLVLKVLMPSRMTRLRREVRRRAFPHPRTRIALDAPGGYSLEEQATIVENLLRTAGLTRGLAPLVAAMAHGATTANNPFRQAYGCGACSGNPGAPNARAFARMANDSRVRALLAARGLPLPTATWFVPCIHDTTTDTVEVLDREDLPEARRAEVADLEARLARACRRNAVERCGRFAQAPRGGAERAAQHVLDRGHDLAQPRPEYGHNRVAACIVGRRSLTARTFLDRRAFLVSYDAEQDAARGAGNTLLRSAVLGSVPVAVNIAMDYYFSRVDPDGFGAGSKLPLNVVSLLGVVTGSKSDLRIGLARQMVELHEPMRIFVLVEAGASALRELVETHPRMRRMVHGGWMRLGRIDPLSRAVELWDAQGFTPWREQWPEFHAVHGAAGLPRVLDARSDRPLEVVA